MLWPFLSGGAIIKWRTFSPLNAYAIFFLNTHSNQFINPQVFPFWAFHEIFSCSNAINKALKTWCITKSLVTRIFTFLNLVVLIPLQLSINVSTVQKITNFFFGCFLELLPYAIKKLLASLTTWHMTTNSSPNNYFNNHQTQLDLSNFQLVLP